MTAQSRTPFDSDADLHVETATIMFADVVESVRLIAADELRNVRRIVALLHKCAAEAVRRKGTVLETRGDGLLIRFRNARDACACALRFHRYAREANEDRADNELIALRIGINEEGVLTDGVAVFGAAVSRTSRITGLANPGETQVSERVREQLVDGIDGYFEDQGHAYVKHETKPIRTFKISAFETEQKLIKHQTLYDDLRPSVAVVPATILSGTGRDTVLRDAFCDCLVALLSRSLALRVIARASAAALTDRENAVRLSAERLNCEYLVLSKMKIGAEGSQIEVELVDTRQSVTVWCEHFSVTNESLADPEGTAVASIAAKAMEVAVNRQLKRLSIERLPNIESQGLMMAGINLLHRQHKNDFDRARLVFEHLADRHPRNPLPYTWLAAWRVFNVTQGWFSEFSVESSIAAGYAERALDLHSEAPLAHSIRGLVATNLEREFDRAEVHFQRALAVNDCDAIAWLHRGVSKAFVGRGETAVGYTGEARRLSPLDPWSYYFDTLGASAAFAAGDYKLAVQLAQSSLRANRLHLSTLRVLAMSYAELGDRETASEYLDRVLVADPTLTVSKYLARSPSAGRPMATMCAAALRKAGLPE